MTLQHKFWKIAPQPPSNTRPLRGAYIYIARVDTANDLLLDGCLEILGKDEHERARSFRFVSDKNTYITAHVLLRSVLSLHFPIPPKNWIFRTSSLGKPEQINLPDKVHFNISHTRGMVCCALSLYQVGIDIESISSMGKLESLNSVFSSQEVRDIYFQPEPDKHLRATIYWTLRESLLKSTGEGISGLTKNFSFSIDDSHGRIYFRDQQSRSMLSKWQFSTFLVDNHYVVSGSVDSSADIIQTIHPYFDETIQLIGVSQNTRVILKQRYYE